MSLINKLLLITLVIVTFASCRTNKNLRVYSSLPNITKNRLIDSILTKEFDYETLYAKKMSVSIFANDKKKSFNASLRIVKDNFIQVSISAPLGIELFRVQLSSDSVRFVDYYNKQYFISDYGSLETQFGITFNYNCLERLLTNRFITLGNCNNELPGLSHFKLNEMKEGYQLSNVQERAIGRKIKKLYKKKRKNKDHILITEELIINPETYRPIQVMIMDYEDNNGLMTYYSDFDINDHFLFPKKLVSILYFEGNRFSIEIDFNKINFNVPVKSNTKVPQKYRRVNLTL